MIIICDHWQPSCTDVDECAFRRCSQAVAHTGYDHNTQQFIIGRIKIKGSLDLNCPRNFNHGKVKLIEVHNFEDKLHKEEIDEEY